MPLRAVRLFAALTMVTGLASASHAADDWMNFAMVSATLGVSDGRVCIGAGNEGDIGCPAYAPRILQDGTVSATRFSGDGSGLTGITADTTDRITSGTTSMVVVSSTRFISLTQAGTNTGWFDPTRGLVTLGVSATGGVSATAGYFSSSIGINAVPSASVPIDIRPTVNAPVAFVNVQSSYGGVFYRGRQTGTGYYYSSGIFRAETDNTTNRNIYFEGITSGTALFRTFSNGDVYAAGQASLGTMAAPSATLHVAGSALITSWTGINFSNSARVMPSAPLEVSGTVSATRFVGDGSGLTNIAGASADRVVSGTTSLVAVSNTGFVSLTQAGANTAWFDPTRGLMALGVSATGTVSASRGSFTGHLTAYSIASTGFGDISSFGLSVNSSAGASRLLVWLTAPGNATTPAIGQNGTASGIFFPTSTTLAFSTSGTETLRMIAGKQVGIGTQTPTVPLEVSGTVSATVVNATTVKLADTSNLPCTPERYGTIRYSNGRQFMCMPR